MGLEKPVRTDDCTNSRVASPVSNLPARAKRCYASPLVLKGQSKTITVTVVDADAAVRESLEQIFQMRRKIKLAGSYASADDVVKAAILHTRPQVIVLDIDMPGAHGIEFIRWLKAKLPKLNILVVTALTDAKSIAAALSVGADGYLAKPFAAGKLLAALEVVRGGGKVFCEQVSQKVAVVVAVPIRVVKITVIFNAHEQTIMFHLAHGLQYKEIADRLDESLPVIHKCVHGIFVKLHVHNRTEALGCWLQGIAPLP